MPYLRAYAESTGGDPGSPIRFVASTEGIKRDGKDLKATDWDVTNYRANPIVLWVHDDRLPPIGRAEVVFDGNRMMADVTFDQQDEFARTIESKYRREFMSAVSVGWLDAPEGMRDLCDVSAVPIPADPQALAERRVRGIADLAQRLLDATEAPTEEAGWIEIASQMVGLYQSVADDTERLPEYRRLEREYKRFDKTPPEFMTTLELEPFTMAEVRGLFLEGEPELLPEMFIEPLRFNQRQVDKLSQALALIQEAIDGAEIEPVQEPAPPEEDSFLLDLTNLLADASTNLTGETNDDE